MKAVIFCGGPGARFWPVSRVTDPKQFKPMIKGRSTFALTVDRVRPETAWSDIYAATEKKYLPIVRQQAPEIPEVNLVGEPARRDLGPAVGYTVALLNKLSPHEPFGIFWSDHIVNKPENFKAAMRVAEKLARQNPNKIIFWGEKIRFPNQNLGHIEIGDEVLQEEGIGVYQFKSWHYRPPYELAVQYSQSGKHLWNLGYFVSTPSFLASEYQKSAPEMWAGLQRIVDKLGTPEFLPTYEAIYPTLEKISFDDAIVVKIPAENGLVMACDMSWSDAGTYEALKEALQTSPEANVTSGKIKDLGSKDSYLYNETDQLVATIGLEGMIVAVTKDAILVCPKAKNPEIKKLLDEFKGTPDESYL